MYVGANEYGDRRLIFQVEHIRYDITDYAEKLQELFAKLDKQETHRG